MAFRAYFSALSPNWPFSSFQQLRSKTIWAKGLLSYTSKTEWPHNWISLWNHTFGHSLPTWRLPSPFDSKRPRILFFGKYFNLLGFFTQRKTFFSPQNPQILRDGSQKLIFSVKSEQLFQFAWTKIWFGGPFLEILRAHLEFLFSNSVVETIGGVVCTELGFSWLRWLSSWPTVS